MVGRGNGIAVALTAAVMAGPAWSQEAAKEAASPPPSSQSAPTGTAAPDPPLVERAQSAATPKKTSPFNRKRRLLDFNKDGKITIKDAFRMAGLHGKFDQLASFNDRGQLRMRNPAKLLGDFLIDLSDDGKIAPPDPMSMVGLQLASFGGGMKLRYGGNRVTLTRTWRY